jgi:hypothetical protein
VEEKIGDLAMVQTKVFESEIWGIQNPIPAGLVAVNGDGEVVLQRGVAGAPFHRVAELP